MDDHFARVLAGPKRAADDADAVADASGSARSKRRRDASDDNRARVAQVLAQGDAAAQEIVALDARALKTMAHALDKAIRRNALMRSKHSDEPAKFMESEMQLDEELTKWKAVAAQPALYGELVELEVVASLLGLFGHENLDIRLDVVNLLAELTDVDEDPSALAPTTRLATHLVAHDFVPLLVKTLDDLDRDTQDRAETEDDASDTGVFHALQIVENIVDVLPDSAVTLGASTSIFSVLLRLVSPKRVFGSTKLYASEVLSILVQANGRNREQFLSNTQEDDLLDRLLQALAPYRKRDPQGDEEEELVENLLNTLCSLLCETQGQDRFRRLEGLELMLRFMKDRKQYVFSGALRVLDHALMNHARNCERFIQVGGLKTLFPMFMGKKVAKKKDVRAKEIENVTSLLASLCLLVPQDADQDVHARLHAKFVENEMEKVDRIVDLFAKYYDRVQAAVARENPDEDEDQEDEDAAADERYLRRLDAGLFVLQRVALVAAHLSRFSRKLRAYVMIKFHERNVDIEAVVAVLHEQLNTLEAEADAETATTNSKADAIKQNQIQQVRQLLQAFDDETEIEDAAAAEEETGESGSPSEANKETAPTE